jgi:filamentous hemagglutinin
MAYVGLNPQTQLLNTSTQTFSGNAVAYQFTLSRAVASASDLDVMIDQTLQRPFTDYEAENVSLLFQSPPGSGTNNITVTYRAGALNSLDLTANAFGAGTVGAPSVYSVAANNSGFYWSNATSVVTTVAGTARLVVSGNANSTSNVTGAVQVVGGIGATGNINTSGIVTITNTTNSANIGTGALVVGGSIGVAGNITIGQNITCVGDFTVNGTFTTTGTDSLDVTDPFVFLANANPGDTYDTGIISQFYDGVANRYTGYFRDITDNKYKLFGNLLTQPTTTVDTTDPSFQLQDLVLANLSATGNVTGNFFLGNGSQLTGILTTVSNVTNGTSGVFIPSLNGNVIINVGGTTISTVSSSVGLAITGNVNATTGISAIGNIVGGNVTTAGIASATGNITSAANIAAGNLLAGGLLSVAGSVTAGAGASITGAMSASGNVTGGNVLTAGFVTATGNVTGGNVRTGGLISATGAIYGNSLSIDTTINSGTDIVASGALSAGTTISAAGTISSGLEITASGNITGSYFLGNGAALTGIDATSIQFGSSNIKIVAANANATINIANVSNVVVFSSTGQTTTGFVSASGNVIAGNLTTAAQVSATGNVTGGNINTGGLISATGNITGGNILGGANVNATTHTGTTAVLSGNVTGGNIITGGAVLATGQISATANVTGGNIITSGVINAGSAGVSASGNVVGGNIVTAGIISSTGNSVHGIANVSAGNAIITSLVQGATLSASGNVVGGNLNAAGLSLSGNVVSGLSMITNITTTANVTGGNILSSGQISTSGNVNATHLNITGGIYDTGTLFINTAANGNIALAPNGTGIVTATGAISAVGNITGGNVISGGARVYKYTASASVPSGGVAGDHWYATGTDKLYMYINDGTTNQWVDQSFPTSISALAINGNLSVGGTLTAANITFSGGAFSVNSLLNSGANGVGNIGATATRFNTVFATTFSGVSTTANYADLAENYQADGEYKPGTVVVFGGENEITVSDIDHDTRIAGVVSTNPAYLMNSEQDNGTPVALAGRVPCLVQGPVTKGDRLVNVASGIAGKFDPAKAELGCVVGKSLQDLPHDHVELIEIAVGRT